MDWASRGRQAKVCVLRHFGEILSILARIYRLKSLFIHKVPKLPNHKTRYITQGALQSYKSHNSH